MVNDDEMRWVLAQRLVLIRHSGDVTIVILLPSSLWMCDICPFLLRKKCTEAHMLSRAAFNPEEVSVRYQLNWFLSFLVLGLPQFPFTLFPPQSLFLSPALVLFLSLYSFLLFPLPRFLSPVLFAKLPTAKIIAILCHEK